MIVALAGGIGAAKFLVGLSRVIPPETMTVIGNTGDDIYLHGLRICPDLDTVAYSLSGVVNPETGWGVKEDTFTCIAQLAAYGQPHWFQLGDKDIATHLYRTRLLNEGITLTEVTRRICRRLQISSLVLPMSEGYHPTLLQTDRGDLHLQEYLIKERCRPVVQGLLYSDSEQAVLPPEVKEAIQSAQAIIICPSNPFISIGPILAVAGMKDSLQASPAPVIAITPIVEGRAFKGPAAKMLKELGFPVSSVSVAELYRDVVDCFVLDQRDADHISSIRELGIEVELLDTVMITLEEKMRLAREILELL